MSESRTPSPATRANSRRTLERRLLIAGVCAGLAGAAALGVMKSLPYSTSWVMRVDEKSAETAPTDVFEIGSVRWRKSDYTQAPSLELFRKTFGPPCGALEGLAAARCITGVLAAHSPRGIPSVEFVDVGYDPTRVLAAHLAGEPGHCTTRSALTVTGLLALGIPARVVQFLPEDGQGHNVVGVWDAKEGWAVFDPFYGATIENTSGPMSSVEVAAANGSRLHWGNQPAPESPDPNAFAGATVQYPEPWLYTRVGERCARWPFRACFAQVGPAQFRVGPAQKLTFLGGLLAGLAAAACLLTAAALRLRPARREAAVDVPGVQVGASSPQS